MKKQNSILMAFLLLTGTLFAQEKAEVSVKIIKEGKVITDTTYVYNDVEKAQQALKVMDLVASDDLNEKIMKDLHTKDHKMVFVSEDGTITETSGDDMKWVTSTTETMGDSVKVIKMKIKGDTDEEYEILEMGEIEEEHEVTVNEKDGKIEIIIKSTGDSEGEKNVEVRKEVILLEDEGAGEKTYTINGDSEEKIIIISGEGDEKGQKVIKKKIIKENEDEEIIWNSDDGENENVEVIVIRKKPGKDTEDVEVEVTVNDGGKAKPSKKIKKNK